MRWWAEKINPYSQEFGISRGQFTDQYNMEQCHAPHSSLRSEPRELRETLLKELTVWSPPHHPTVRAPTQAQRASNAFHGLMSKYASEGKDCPISEDNL